MKGFILAVVTVIVVYVCGMVEGWSLFMEDAIKHHAAYYSVDSGKKTTFHWNDEKEPK